MVRSAHKLNTLAYLCLRQIRRYSKMAQTTVATDALAISRNGGHGVNRAVDTTHPVARSALGARTVLPSVDSRSEPSDSIPLFTASRNKDF